MLVGSLVFEPPTPQRRGFLKAHQLWTETDTLWENGDVEEIASEQWQERSWFCLDYRRHTINIKFIRDYTNPISANLYETTAREWDHEFFFVLNWIVAILFRHSTHWMLGFTGVSLHDNPHKNPLAMAVSFTICRYSGIPYLQGEWIPPALFLYFFFPFELRL